jgi:hypothetical protein
MMLVALYRIIAAPIRPMGRTQPTRLPCTRNDI